MSQTDNPSPAEVESDAEKRLLSRLRSADESAFEEVVRANWPRLMAVARRFLPVEEDAQDAVQDAFLSAFRGIDAFKEDARLGTWLHRIVVNAALMKIRSRRNKSERSIEDMLPKFKQDGHLAGPSSDWVLSIDDAAGQRETQEVVRQGIDRLPDMYRNVLMLRDIEERSTEESAQLLGISNAAVKTRLHRARLALRNLLDPIMTGTSL